MSGGSFNYLCDTWDLDHLLGKQGSLEAMSQALATVGYAQDAARETEELLVLLRQWQNQAEVRLKRLTPVWKAMEWWKSNDWGEDDFREALAEYRTPEQTPSAPPAPTMQIHIAGSLTAEQRAEVAEIVKAALRRAGRWDRGTR